MATMYAGGGRRSVAPTLDLATPNRMPALNFSLAGIIPNPALDSLLRSMLAYEAGDGSTSTSPSFGAGDVATSQGAGGLGQLGAMAGLLGSLGVVTETPELAQMGTTLGQVTGALGLGSQLSHADNITDVVTAFAGNPAALSALGLPGLAAGATSGAVKGGFEGAVTNVGKGLAYGAVPALGLVDATLSLLGVQTLADRFIGTFTGSSAAATESGDVNGGVDAGGVTVGGPMSTGDITGTDLGAPTGEFGGGFGDFGGFGGFGGDFGGSGDYGGGFGDTAGSGNDGGDNGAGDGGDSGDSGDSGW